MGRFGRRLLLVLSGCGLTGIAHAGERQPQQLYLQQDIVRDWHAPDALRDEFLDTTILVSWPHMHASFTFGSFDMGAEWGGFIRDGRGSAYGLTLRRRGGGRVENTSMEIETLQKVQRTVLGVSAKLFWPDDPAGGDALSLVPAARFEAYYGDYSFASLRVTHDPRPGTGTTFRLANRLAGERRSIEVSIAPRTDGAVGWGFAARSGVLVAGLSLENDYDFTAVDRLLVFFGFDYDLQP